MTSQYFQDSNQPVGTVGSANYIPALIPGTTLLDLAGDWQLTRNLRLLGGVSNLTNQRYYNRVFQNGIEPGADRRFYLGLALGI